LRDKTSKTWKIDELGELASNATGTVLRKGQRMAMSNRGVEIVELLVKLSDGS
jgi:hypothetical protein